ncbi:MAG: V-type ATPase 116kDa subunit family protein [Thermodesulfobacteriota bacterium]
MISPMSKVAVVGPKHLAGEVLAAVQQVGALHIDPDLSPIPAVPETGAAPFSPSAPDENLLSLRAFYEGLLVRVNDMLECLPEVDSRMPQLSQEAVIHSLHEVTDRHLRQWKEWCAGGDKLRTEIGQLSLRQELINRLNGLVERHPPEGQVAVALELPGDAPWAALTTAMEAIGDQVAVERRTVKGGTEVAVIRFPATDNARVMAQLAALAIPEFDPPLALDTRSLRLAWEEGSKLLGDLANRLTLIEEKRLTFARRWRGIYLLAHDWLHAQLALIEARADLYETGMCFWLFGWLPSPELPRLRDELAQRFRGQVVVEEQEIREHDLARVPIVLRNPGYFQPFELFVRLLPVPAYTSFDLTPFIAIFFPLFFGMMLGDMGYGVILLMAALITIPAAKKHPLVVDAAKILGVCAVYTLIFGFLFGELFGAVGRRFMHLPHLIDRQGSIVPMLSFALSVGLIHIGLGLALGVVAAFRQGEKREGLFKLGSIVLICLVALILFSFRVETLAMLTTPLLMALGVLLPLLIFAGGFMAPLEVLQTIGNIVSYARIMAIGLTSVLLAYVANHLAGAVGSIWMGLLVASLLHALNIVLGVFAPTVHSLRLHYVEFLGKFITMGGRKFAPLGKS